MKSPKGDIYTNNPKGKNVIEEKFFSKNIFTMKAPKLGKQVILC